MAGSFRLASGKLSDFKIECDALTDDDWAAIAQEIAKRADPFGEVFGIPRGGLPLAEHMKRYASTGPRLLVDDVWTTGGTLMQVYRPGDQVWVAYARGRMDPTIKARALFYMEGATP